MNRRAAWKKFNDGLELSDRELLALIDSHARILNMFKSLGPNFKSTSTWVSQRLERLNELAISRMIK